MSNVKALPAPKAPAAERAPRMPGEFRRVMRILNRFLKGNRGVFLMAMVMLIAESATEIAAKYPLAYLIDYLSGQRPELLAGLGLTQPFSPRAITLAVLTCGIVGIALLNSMADSLSEIYLARGGRQLGFSLRSALYSHLQKLSLAFYSRQRTGDLLTRVTGDVTALEEFTIKSLKDIAGSVFILTLSLIALFSSSWQIAVVALVMVPVLSVVSNYFADRIKAAAKKLRSREGELAASAQEMLTSIRVIQTYGSGGDQLKRFADLSKRTMETALQAARLQAWFSGVFNVLQAITIVLVVLVGVWLVDRTTITLGALVFFIGVIQDMFKPTRRIIKQWNDVGKIIASVERIGEVLDRKPAVQDLPGAVEAAPFKGHVEFKNVSFAYQVDPEDAAGDGAAEPQLRLALNNISFDMKPGEVVALVGGSGAGKSTIVQLLPRLYDPHLGQVLIDGHDIREFTLDSLRSQMSMVLQEAILFAGTVAENIAYGRPHATREEIIAAAIQANAHEFITRLPEGYDTQLSERATNLSGGQRQRIAIARAFIRNTPILILDEPTTGLDAESTDLVLSALRTLMKGKTTIIISHDLNLIRQADKIVVIRAGQIEQIGTHKELLRSGGLYADLYHKQFGQAVKEQGGQIAPLPQPAVVLPAEDDEESEPIAPQAFQTMMTQVLPKPVSSAAFQTMMMRMLPRRDGEGADATPGPVGTAPAAPAAPPAPAVAEPPPRRAPAIGETIAIRREMPHLAGDQPPVPAMDGAAGALSAAAARLDGAQLDPLRTPALLHALPGLKAAFDAPAMRARLQTLLFGKTAARYTIERCVPGKAIYLAEEGCALRYQLEVRDTASGQALPALVNARLFGDQLACAVYMRDRLAPLMALMHDREELRVFETPAALIEPLNMAVSVFPIDGELPTLVGATDRQRMLDVFREVLEASDDGFGPQACRVELAHYARRSRCVLRYLLDGTLPGGKAQQHRVVYGKVTVDGRGAIAAPAMVALRAWVLSNRSPYQFNIPRPLGWRPDLQLLLMEAIPGVPLIDQLLKTRLSGFAEPEDDTLSLEEALAAAAHAANALHTSGVAIGQRRVLDDELAGLRREIESIHSVAPQLAAQLQAWLEQIETYAEESDPLPRCFCHGNFRHSKLLFDSADSGLVDFDTVCQAEPALDLGQFLAYLRVAIQKTQSSAVSVPTAIAEQLCEHFLSTYIAAAGDQLEDAERLRIRVAVYEAVSLLRTLIHSWQVIKVSRIEHVVAVLEERLARLPELNY